jgi:hypothetical protein
LRSEGLREPLSELVHTHSLTTSSFPGINRSNEGASKRYEKGNPVVRRVRKTTGLFEEAGLPNSGGAYKAPLFIEEGGCALILASHESCTKNIPVLVERVSKSFFYQNMSA